MLRSTMLRGLFGVVHLRALPGDPGRDGNVHAPVDRDRVRRLVYAIGDRFGAAPP